jgi:hypothetical protein
MDGKEGKRMRKEWKWQGELKETNGKRREGKKERKEGRKV